MHLDVSAVVRQEGGLFTAHAHDHDHVARGHTMEEALLALKRSIARDTGRSVYLTGLTYDAPPVHASVAARFRERAAAVA